MHQEKTEKEDLLKLRKIASTIAKEVKHFWDSIQKVRVMALLNCSFYMLMIFLHYY